jgi:hypothetical protein
LRDRTNERSAQRIGAYGLTATTGQSQVHPLFGRRDVHRPLHDVQERQRAAELPSEDVGALQRGERAFGEVDRDENGLHGAPPARRGSARRVAVPAS